MEEAERLTKSLLVLREDEENARKGADMARMQRQRAEADLDAEQKNLADAKGELSATREQVSILETSKREIETAKRAAEGGVEPTTGPHGSDTEGATRGRSEAEHDEKQTSAARKVSCGPSRKSLGGSKQRSGRPRLV